MAADSRLHRMFTDSSVAVVYTALLQVTSFLLTAMHLWQHRFSDIIFPRGSVATQLT